MTQEVTERQCKKCGETKPIEEFYKYKNGKPISQCKSCKRTYYKANRQRHKDQMMKDQFNNYYTVYCIAFPDGMRYVGSTKRKVKYRLHHHWSSKVLIEISAALLSFRIALWMKRKQDALRQG